MLNSPQNFFRQRHYSTINFSSENPNIYIPPNISMFEMIIPLAKGGYGKVDLYKKKSTGDYFAIKTVNIESIKEKNLSSTLKNETDILSKIRCDYVVNSYYIFRDIFNLYFVMEYMPGGDLFRLLSSIELPLSTIQLASAETLLAIQYLHKINIIHKDIKPENILISKEGHFKLTDFGLSQITKNIDRDLINNNLKSENERNSVDSMSLNSENLLNTITIGNSEEESEKVTNKREKNIDNPIVGTLNYMAPELFLGGEVDGRIDYWAFGVLLYELFTFKVPFYDDDQKVTKENILGMKINWKWIEDQGVKESYGEGVVADAIDLIKKFIVFEPAKRWGDENFEEIKKHPLFKDFSWDNIGSVQDVPTLQFLKKNVLAANKKIKIALANKKKKEKNNNFNDNNFGNKNLDVSNISNNNSINNSFMQKNFDKNVDNYFRERFDNLFTKNQEVVKLKFRKKEFQFNENDNLESLVQDMI